GRRLGEEAPERLAREAAVVGLAVELEELGERETGGPRDEIVELDEGPLDAGGELVSHRALAGAAEAEGRHMPLGLGPRPRAEEIGHLDAERLGDGREAGERDVPLPLLELRQEARRQLGAAGELALGPAERGTARPNIGPHVDENPGPHEGTILHDAAAVKQ